jgi:hypothetical protein
VLEVRRIATLLWPICLGVTMVNVVVRQLLGVDGTWLWIWEGDGRQETILGWGVVVAFFAVPAAVALLFS